MSVQKTTSPRPSNNYASRYAAHTCGLRNMRGSRGVVVLHRHGNRSPGKNFFETCAERRDVKESEYWKQHLIPREHLLRLSHRFPIHGASTPGAEYDGLTSSFGQLTRTGHAQLKKLGQRLQNKYAIENSPISTFSKSTNYARTLESARSLLEGLRGAEATSPKTTPFVHLATPSLAKQEEETLSQVDPLNPWSTDPDLRAAAQELERTDPRFLQWERDMAEIKREFLTSLPLYRSKPESFSWVWAADYFVARETYPDAEKHPSSLWRLRNAVVEQSARQFVSWYADPRVLSRAAGPILKGTLNYFHGLNNASASHASGLVVPKGTDMVLLSAHDVTVLPLLCALGVLRSTDSNLHKAWPGYASSIVMDYKHDGSIEVSYDDGSGEDWQLIAQASSLEEFEERVVKSLRA